MLSECVSHAGSYLEERETELIRRGVGGDPKALHQLVEEHARYLHGTAYAMLGKASDAEDVVQETFLAAFKGIGRFGGRSALRTWLVGILVRQVALLHRHRRGKLTVGLDERQEQAAGSVGAETRKVDERLDVAQMLERLSPEHREVLILREYDGMSYEEIAAALDVPRGTVESRLHRARQELRGWLSGYE